MGDDHKPSIPRPVLAIDYSRTPYHHSLSPFTQPTKEAPTVAAAAEPHPPAGNSMLLENQALPINPDIPIKDVLFVFSGFSSYMKSPNQGATGVSDGDLRHAARLLEHARVSLQWPFEVWETDRICGGSRCRRNQGGVACIFCMSSTGSSNRFLSRRGRSVSLRRSRRCSIQCSRLISVGSQIVDGRRQLTDDRLSRFHRCFFAVGTSGYLRAYDGEH